jgi:hypothetical protein
MAKTRKAGKKSRSAKPVAKPKARKVVAKSPKALRLTFSYQGAKVKLVSQQPVQMTLPPSDSLEGYEEQKGFWAELKNDKKKTLYRRVLHNPTRNDAEVFSDDPAEGISRRMVPERTGVFTVVVPDTAQGHEVLLSRSSAPPTTKSGSPRRGVAARTHSLATGPAEVIKRVKLKK